MLTDLSCKALIADSKRQNKPLKKADSRGLFLHAFPSGSALWKHRYRIGGVTKEISYGPYQMVSLKEARELHGDSYKKIKVGDDPGRMRREVAQRVKDELADTFEAVGLVWFNRNLENWSARHARRLKNRLQRNLFLPLGKRPISQISRKELLTVIRAIEDRSRETAKRCTQYTLGIFRYARDEELIKVNVALDLENSLKPYRQGHYPSMHIDELPNFLKKLAGPIKGNASDKRDVLELLMLTLVRSMELISAEYDEFDLSKNSWTIPAHKMKMGKPHIVPLSRQAIQIIERRFKHNLKFLGQSSCKYLFPSARIPGNHLSHTIASNTLIELGYRDHHTSHGFRSLGMGIAKQKLGYRHEVPNKQLAHEPRGDVDRAYDRADFFEERVEMMQRLADYIDKLRKG